MTTAHQTRTFEYHSALASDLFDLANMEWKDNKFSDKFKRLHVTGTYHNTIANLAVADDTTPIETTIHLMASLDVWLGWAQDYIDSDLIVFDMCQRMVHRLYKCLNLPYIPNILENAHATGLNEYSAIVEILREYNYRITDKRTTYTEYCFLMKQRISTTFALIDAQVRIHRSEAL